MANEKTTTEPLQHSCSFCKRKVTIRSQYDMPIYDPQTGFAICNSCIREIYNYIAENDTQQAELAKSVNAAACKKLGRSLSIRQVDAACMRTANLVLRPCAGGRAVRAVVSRSCRDTA